MADPVEPAVDSAHPGRVTLGGVEQIAEVGAGAKCRSGTGEHDGGDVVALLEVIKGGDKVADQSGGEDVAAAGVIQGEPGDPPVVRADVDERHGRCAGNARARR